MVDDGRGHHPVPDGVAHDPDRRARLAEPVDDHGLQPPRQPQAAVALGEVHEGQPGVELGAQELLFADRRGRVGGEQLVQPAGHKLLVVAGGDGVGGGHVILPRSGRGRVPGRRCRDVHPTVRGRPDH